MSQLVQCGSRGCLNWWPMFLETAKSAVSNCGGTHKEWSLCLWMWLIYMYVYVCISTKANMSLSLSLCIHIYLYIYVYICVHMLVGGWKIPNLWVQNYTNSCFRCACQIWIRYNFIKRAVSVLPAMILMTENYEIWCWHCACRCFDNRTTMTCVVCVVAGMFLTTAQYTAWCLCRATAVSATANTGNSCCYYCSCHGSDTTNLWDVLFLLCHSNIFYKEKTGNVQRSLLLTLDSEPVSLF